MRLELRLAGKRLATGGALTSDDVSLSHAYIEACEELGLTPRLLVDGYKASGFRRPVTPLVSVAMPAHRDSALSARRSRACSRRREPTSR